LQSVRAGQPFGVTVAVCCHNSAKLLPQTLEYLKAQRVPYGIQWEVLVVDNASTDGTADVARRCWQGNRPAPLRVTHEPRLGLSNARERAFQDARFEIVSFIDDDNLVSDGWVAAAIEIMSGNPQLGAMGGLVYPKFEAEPPIWWYNYTLYFALVPEAPAEKQKVVHGAGMTIRKSAWEEIVRCGFRSRLSGHHGKRLTCGEDDEITFALGQAGWDLRIDDRLRMLHFIEARRLDWNYLRRMARGYASSWVYLSVLLADPEERGRVHSRSWQRQLLGWFKYSGLRPVAWWHWMFSRLEGDPLVIEMERELGRAIGILTFRGEISRLARSAPPALRPASQLGSARMNTLEGTD
jgi:glycosyltransferase involved in cell wall biosynthesis